MHSVGDMPSSTPKPHPPQPPDQPSRLRLSRSQWVGLPLMALVPVLALAGAFGERRERRQEAHGALLVAAHLPTRLRYRQRMTLDVSVTNRGGTSLDDVRIRVDSAYLDRFSGVSLSPSVSPDGGVAFGSLAARQSVRLSVTLEGDRAGAIRGTALVTDAEGDSVRVPLSSIVFP
jgi:hypothetical protein